MVWAHAPVPAPAPAVRSGWLEGACPVAAKGRGGLHCLCSGVPGSPCSVQLPATLKLDSPGINGQLRDKAVLLSLFYRQQILKEYLGLDFY